MKMTALVLAMLFSAFAAAGDGLPIVMTRFQITGKRFPSGLGSAKDQAERDVGAAVAQLMSTKYPFFRWCEESDANASAVAKLTITLVEQQISSTLSSFHLEYQRQIVPGWIQEPMFRGDRDLYSRGKRNVPYSDAQTLSNDVVARLTELLDKTRKSDFEVGFIQKVPICSCPAVLPDPATVSDPHTIVITGFNWGQLKAAADSLLVVTVDVSKSRDDGPEFIAKGWIRLTNLQPVKAGIGGHLGQIHCANADLDQSHWDQQKIKDALDHRRGAKMQLFVHEYAYDDSAAPAQTPD